MPVPFFFGTGISNFVSQLRYHGLGIGNERCVLVKIDILVDIQI